MRRLTRATYDGAYAGALMLGAIIGDNMVFTAGVSHGFNKGGTSAVSSCSLSGHGRP
ncbi:hypothetical protein [Sphingomonas sp.]|uniref:hypothetical protein n=1 Tax=Sphingomonas sp. TaxID=28214 RepID=UPI00286B3848|nr:hypothetical protein [Sphingomonas sp.]